jgi:integrase
VTPVRKTIQTFGQKRRGDYVRVLLDPNRGRYEVHFDEPAGGKAKKTFADDKQGKKEALAWAETFYDERKRQAEASRAPSAPPARRTTREIWKLYTASPAYLKGIRQKSRDNYAARWRKWEEYLGPDFVVDATTFHDVDGFITRAGDAGMVINQVRQVINVARIVYNWAASRDLILVNKLGVYRWQTPKDALVHEPGDYATSELDAMLRTLDPTRHDQWRPWVAIVLVAESGQRANAIRNLRWDDIDWAAGEIVWRGEFQKQGKELRRPITWGLYSALLVAQHWATVELRARPEHGARIRNALGQIRARPRRADGRAPIAVGAVRGAEVRGRVQLQLPALPVAAGRDRRRESITSATAPCTAAGARWWATWAKPRATACSASSTSATPTRRCSSTTTSGRPSASGGPRNTWEGRNREHPRRANAPRSRTRYRS